MSEYAWLSTKQHCPASGGTLPTWDGHEIRYLYWNTNTRRWHPVRGWRRKVGLDPGTVTHFVPLPPRPRA